MITPDLRATAHLIAKLLASRPTPPEEVAGLIYCVHGALSRLGQEEEQPVLPQPPQRRPATAAPRRKRQEVRMLPLPLVEEAPPPPAPPPAPKLVRRADVAVPPPAPGPLPAAAAGGANVRGIVKWFDPRSGKGALRLPGFAGDVTLEARHLTESGIARLFKGQEIEATVTGGSHAPVLERLALPGAAPPMPIGSGVVHSRRAKPVLVELKREALRRAAARAEAEHLLGPSRPR
jgi:cold shock CspA family protein